MDNRQSADSISASDRILRRAHSARAECLRNLLYNCAHKLRERICAGAVWLRIKFLPMCCQ